jgi:hypothetical protein
MMRQVAHSTSAFAYLLGGRIDEAEREARAVLESDIPLHTAASVVLGVLARIHFDRGSLMDAFQLAKRGLDLQRQRGEMPLDGSALHLVHAEAQHAIGDLPGARASIVTARDRVLRIAATFDDESLRSTYLGQPHNARTLELAEMWTSSPPAAR